MKITIKTKQLVFVGVAAVVLALAIILVGAYSGFLGARYAPGLKFAILGPDILIAGDKANIAWDSSPENYAAYPEEKIEVCKSKIFGKQCKTLASSVTNQGKATVNIPANIPLGASYLRLTARANKLLVPDRTTIRAVRVVAGVNFSQDKPIKITWKVDSKYQYVIIQYCVPSNGKCYTISGRANNSGSLDGLFIPGEAGDKKGYFRIRALDNNGKPVVVNGKFVEFDATATEGTRPSKPKSSPKSSPTPAPSAVDLKVFDYVQGKFVDGPVTTGQVNPILLSWASTSVSSCRATHKLNQTTATADKWTGAKDTSSATSVVDSLAIGTHEFGLECFKTSDAATTTAAPDATDKVAVNLGVSSDFNVSFISPTVGYTVTNNQLPVSIVVNYPSTLDVSSSSWSIDGVALVDSDWLSGSAPAEVANSNGVSSAYAGTILLNRFGTGSSHTLSVSVTSTTQLAASNQIVFTNSSSTGATFVDPTSGGSYASGSDLTVNLNLQLDADDSLACQKWTLNNLQMVAADWSLLPAGFSTICPSSPSPTPTTASGHATMISPVAGLRVLKNGYLPVSVVVWHQSKQNPGQATWKVDDVVVPSSSWITKPAPISIPTLSSAYIGVLKMSNYEAGQHTISFSTTESDGGVVSVSSTFTVASTGSLSDLNIGGLNIPDGLSFIPNLPIDISSILESIFGGTGFDLSSIIGSAGISVCSCENPSTSNSYGMYSCGGTFCIPSVLEY